MKVIVIDDDIEPSSVYDIPDVILTSSPELLSLPSPTYSSPEFPSLPSPTLASPPLLSLPSPTVSQSPNPTQSSQGETRAHVAISALTSDRLEELLRIGAQYSESTERKHEWALKLYKVFAEYARVAPFPLTKEPVAGFIRFLAFDAKYATGSIEDVIVPSLRRLHQRIVGEDVPADVSECISQAYRDIKNSRSHKARDDGKHPAIAADVRRIVEVTPENLPTKAAEASLWIIAVSTGARAITCANVALSDIKRVYFTGGDNCIVQIRYRVTKGDANWNHDVSIEGEIDRKTPLNAVYWLNQHLTTSFGLCLRSFNDWNITSTDISLWGMSKDSMRETFKDRAIRAGFPAKLFSFHSLRAGFLCSALLRAGSNAGAVRSILENTAFVAGWVPHQAAQLRYVRDCARRTIIASRLVMPAEEGLSAEPVEVYLSSPETFHGIQLSPPSWPIDTNYRLFFKKIDDYIMEKIQSEPEPLTLKPRIWREAYYQFIIHRPELKAELDRELERKPEWSNTTQRWNLQRRLYQSEGRNHLASEFHETLDNFESYLEEFKRHIDRYLEREGALERRAKRPSLMTRIAEPLRERFENGQRKRFLWRPEDDRVLVLGVKSGKSWVQISREIQSIPPRNNVDCKDRWRNLVKKYGSPDSVFLMYNAN